MRDKRFDERMKEELENFRFEDMNADWDEFSKKLELAELKEDMRFDSQVSEILTDHNADGVSDWPVLEEKMKERANTRRKVIGMKSAELIIFLLLIFTYFHLDPLNSIRGIEKHDQELHIADRTQPHGQADQNHFAKEIGSKEDFIKTSSQQPNNSINQSALHKNEDPAVLKAESEIVVLNESVELEQNISILKEELVIKEIASAELSLVSARKQTFPNRIPVNKNDLERLVDKRVEVNIAPLDLKNTLFLDSEKIKPGVPEISGIDEPLDSKMWLNIYAGANLDIIDTPFDPVYGVEAYSQSSSSNRLGASFSFYQNNFEMETGVHYTNKAYRPKFIVKEVAGRSGGSYSETSLQHIDFKILQIPLRFKYHFTEYRGWNMYAMAGNSLNIIALAKYDVRMKVLSEPASPNPVPGNGPSKINDKNFNEGLLLDRVMSSNSYFTLDLGAGIQKSISSRASIFIESGYSHHIFRGGVGPNVNRINNISITTGVKTLIR